MRVANDVLAVLSAAQFNGRELRIQQQLDRSMYERVNKVLEAAGGKWKRSARAHIFDSDAEQRIEQVLLSGEITIPQDFGYYPTPPELVARLIQAAGVMPGHRVLEPSAGQGAIALAMDKMGADVWCVELLPENASILSRAGMLKVACADFLTVESMEGGLFDRVVMNPPFERQQDIKHVLHAFKYLKRGGTLVSIMSAGVLFRTDRRTKEFFDWVVDLEGDFTEIEAGAFKSSGTMVHSCMLRLSAPE